MKLPTLNKKRIVVSLKELAFFGVYSALMIAFKEAMAGLANIEPVTVMLIACTCVYGIKALLPAYVFSIIEILIYGFHLWNLMYLYVWAVLVVLALLLRPLHRLIGRLKKGIAEICQTAMWAALSALFGLSFGTLCALPYFITSGYQAGIAWIIAGFGFDIAHCIGNVFMTVGLFYPLYRILLLTKPK